MAKSRIIKKELASGKVSLETGLKQLKVLLTEFNKSEMLRWVNCELQGYGDSDIINQNIELLQKFNWYFLKLSVKMYQYRIPLNANAPDEMVNICTNVKLYDSISALRMLNDNSKEIEAKFLPHICHIFSSIPQFQ